VALLVKVRFELAGAEKGFLLFSSLYGETRYETLSMAFEQLFTKSYNWILIFLQEREN